MQWACASAPGWRTGKHQAAVLQPQHLVVQVQALWRQVVGDNQDRLARQREQLALDQVAGLAVHRRKRLVQQQNRLAGHQCPDQLHQLLLPAAAGPPGLRAAPAARVARNGCSPAPSAARPTPRPVCSRFRECIRAALLSSRCSRASRRRCRS